jgi:class 3 adenylate cyclase
VRGADAATTSSISTGTSPSPRNTDPKEDPGQILVANKVVAAVDDRVESIPLGDVEFKGLSRPVPIAEITALR